MSGINVSRVVERRIKIALSDPETLELDKEIERLIGQDNIPCEKILAEIDKISDEKLRELVEKIRKKKKIIAGVS
jgi:GTP-binding protein EngB required for normal cell division